MKVIIEGSGRHIHVTQEHLEALCGAGFQLDVKKELSQPGQFATSTKLDIVGPKGTLKGVSILGPCRKATQVEVSFTDARVLGVSAPVRESGDLAGSPGCTLVGPAGSVELAEGVIIAKRHIHFTPEDAASIGVVDKQIVSVAVEGERAGVLGQVVARVSPDYATFMHVDYDEMNGMAIFGKDPMGEVIV
ncbi:MAG: phosphate propanoyltransferase [Oscillospiraceae bacterium]|nr:phosphate propanoyltransferase [Oscillospiraceae bacterium]